MTINSPAFFMDTQICTGCKTCMVACRDKHDLALGIRWRRVYEFGGGTFVPHKDGTYTQDVFTCYLSIGCNHCHDPICVESCPTKAMNKTKSGIVCIDESRCVGCRYCEWACPYSAPQFDPSRGVMTKCDFCRDDILEGRSPACVAACPTRALSFGNHDELMEGQGTRADMIPLPDPGITNPCLLIRHPRKDGNFSHCNGMISNPEEVKHE